MLSDKLTRREMLGGGFLSVIPLAQYALEKWKHQDMVPLSRLDEAYRTMDKMRIEHSNDLKAQFQRHLEAYNRWMEQGCP